MKTPVFFIVLFSAIAANAQTIPEYKVVASYHIASPGGWDYLAAHEGKLYVSHGAQ